MNDALVTTAPAQFLFRLVMSAIFYGVKTNKRVNQNLRAEESVTSSWWSESAPDWQPREEQAPFHNVTEQNRKRAR